MRKQTKIAALVSAAALLTIGAAMTSFASGWTMEDGQWVYLNRDGDRVEDEWKTSNGGYYYLGEDGYMVTNQIVKDDKDNIYYVDGTGLRVTNQWVSVDNVDDEVVQSASEGFADQVEMVQVDALGDLVIQFIDGSGPNTRLAGKVGLCPTKFAQLAAQEYPNHDNATSL